jgi:hypothetical protein
MKTKTTFISLLLFILFITATAQNPSDSLAIKNACRNYIEGWHQGNMEKISTSVSPELVKRTVMADSEGKSYTSGMSYSLFKTFSRSSRNGIQMQDFRPDEEFSFEVVIYDISGDFATAKTIVPKYNFFDYCQLAKFDGEWKIFNILWGWIPQQQQ